jgi:hypothetical protein
MTTNRTTKTLTNVKMLVKMADDLMPKPSRTVQKLLVNGRNFLVIDRHEHTGKNEGDTQREEICIGRKEIASDGEVFLECCAHRVISQCVQIGRKSSGNAGRSYIPLFATNSVTRTTDCRYCLFTD